MHVDLHMIARRHIYLLAVVLEQETELRPSEIMTDTAGYADTGRPQPANSAFK